MNDFLSPDQIEALFDRASEGNLPIETDRQASGGRRARWLRTVDFTRPTKFSTDQERRLRRLVDSFCANAAQRVMAEHRLPMELEVIDVQQLTWANAFKQVPDASVHCTVDTAPHEGKLLFSAELPLLVAALEGLLGGDPTQPPATRELSDIDLIIVRRLVRTQIDVLSGIWFDHAEVTLSLADVINSSDNVQVAPGSEPTLMLTMEARLHHVSATVSLLVPYAAIAPAAAAFSQRDEEPGRHDVRSTAAVRHSVEQVDLTLRAEIADCVLTLEQVADLRPGDVVRLDADADADVVLFADRSPIHRGKAGRAGHHRAVMVSGPVEAAP